MMSVETVRAFLGWSTLINWGFLLTWWLFLVIARDWTRQVHSRWFALSEDRFDEIHYRGWMTYKIAILLFNLGPYLALRIVS